MTLIGRGLFVLGGIALGVLAINHFVFGNTGDLLPMSARMGEWRKAAIREACYPALEHPERDPLLPKLPSGAHRIEPADQRRATEMTAALNCYVVTNVNALCEPNNRAWIVDYIDKYYDKKDDMLAIARRYGDAEVRNVEQLWNSPRNQAIQAALVRNIRDGRLSKSDFGWSAPDALMPALSQYQKATDTCPPAKAGTDKRVRS